MIWERAIPDPRVVPLKTHNTSRCEHAMVRVRSDMVVPDRCQNHGYPHSNGTPCTSMDGVLPADMDIIDVVRKRIKDDDQLGFSSEAKIPSLLLVCKESCKVASKRYQRAFPYEWSFAETYFDYERDTLLLSNKQIQFAILPEDDKSHLMARSEACKIRNLALQFRPNPRASARDDRSVKTEDLAEILELFCNVENLTIVVENHLPSGHANGLSSSRNDNEPVLFEAIEINEALLMFSLERRFSDYHGGLLQENVNRLKLRFCMKCLNRKRLQDIANGFVWNLPTFQWKILTTAAFQARFERLQKDYELRTGNTCHRIHETYKLTLDTSQLFLHP
ncbi:3dbfa0db-e5cf-4050-9980-ca6a4f9e33dc [Sclerotinia trifoliorum]|uniref:3dbfa0db-e5cf-4050-9980-ca6a4f9e33dc n=1 Tax=Sclerotinia trifoliorum TaxID=28548 RepID=A0A8H2W5A0_9HELO|nr:3dbfa0db-e5cf-4050-9980-ca6a4f9e33dc [Sclerotinia trifoliorum]